jgi:hypothetical protein
VAIKARTGASQATGDAGVVAVIVRTPVRVATMIGMVSRLRSRVTSISAARAMDSSA